MDERRMTADVELLPLPAIERWEVTGDYAFPTATAPEGHAVDYDDHVAAMQSYARACVAHATAAKDAEIEALRADLADYMAAANSEATRAERLAEALRGLKDLMLRQVKWESCDCGCPQQRTPDGPHSVTWLRAAQQVEIAIGQARGEGGRMKREDVQRMLRKAESVNEVGVMSFGVADVAALCRRWLAVDEADSMQVLTGPRGFGEIVCMPSLIGQRVRIVPEQGEG